MKKVLILGLVLAILAILAVPMAAFADTTGGGTTPVYATMVSPSISFTAPGYLNFGTLTPGWNYANSGSPTTGTGDGAVGVTAGSDGNVGWTVSAQDVNGNGYMYLNSAYLQTPLYIGLGDYEYTNEYYNASAGVSISGSTSSDAIRLDAEQLIGASDTEAAGQYSITITFSASCTL